MSSRPTNESMKFSIEQIWIDEDAQGYPLTRDIVQKLPEAEVLVGNEFAERSRMLDLEPDPMRHEANAS